MEIFQGLRVHEFMVECRDQVGSSKVRLGGAHTPREAGGVRDKNAKTY